MNIWIIDDSEGDRELTRIIVERAVPGHVVTCLSGMEDTLAELSSGVPQLALIDYRLGLHTGDDVANYLPRVTRVYILATITDKDNVLRVLRGGSVDGWLAKPLRDVEIQTLLAGLSGQIDD